MSKSQDLAQWQHPPPKDWQKFERFCCDLWKAIWKDPDTQRNGRDGQAQHGVDVFGKVNTARWGGVQCKKRDAYADDTLTVEELRKIVTSAKGFKPKLAILTVAYTGHSDEKLQREARLLTEANRGEGSFDVAVASWDDMLQSCGDHGQVGEKYFFDGYGDGPPSGDDERYRAWMQSLANKLRIPGLDVTLPIKSARFRLRLLEKEATRAPRSLHEWMLSYREWERLASDTIADGVDSQYVDQLPKKLVVVAGPGVGKSTLLRRLAHQVCESNQTAVWARAPIVLRHLSAGCQFHEALVRASTTGFQDGRTGVRLDDAAVLLLDGLDECDRRRTEICSGLVEWSAARPSTRVVATTRPVGHDPSLLVGWQHSELLPLSADHRRIFVEDVLKTSVALGATSAAFFSKVDASSAATLAARNPLLLGFLIGLFLENIDFGEARTELFERVVERLRTHPLHDREAPAVVSGPVARFVLHRAGRFLLESSDVSRNDLVALIAHRPDLPSTPMQELSSVDEAITFWEHQRLFESLGTAGGAVSFAHLSLAEFSAGCELSSWSMDDLRSWVRAHRRSPRWREAFVFAGGKNAYAGKAIIDELLELDDPMDAASTEAILAAAVLVESRGIATETVARCVQHLVQRVVSANPEVAFDAGRALVGVAQIAPSIVAPLVRGLESSERYWTRWCACNIGVSCGDGHYRVSAVEGVIREFGAPRRSADGGERRRFFEDVGERDIRGEVTTKYAELALKSGDQARITSMEELLLRCPTSFGTTLKVLELFRRYGHAAMASRLTAERFKELGKLDGIDFLGDSRVRLDAADRVLLDTLVRICGVPAVARDAPSHLPIIGLLLAGLEWMKAPLGCWVRLGTLIDSRVLEVVLRGAIVAFDLPREALAVEAAWALANFDRLHEPDRDTDRKGFGILEYTGPVAPKSDWRRGAAEVLDAQPLFDVLAMGEDPIAHAAAELLRYGAGGDEADARLREALLTDDADVARYAGIIAADRWKERAISPLLEAIPNEPTRTSAQLLRPLAYLLGPSSDPAMWRPLVAALHSTDTRIARAGAEALVNLPAVPSEIQEELLEALERRWEKYEPATGNSRLVLETPGGPLLEFLLRVGALTRARVLALTSHWDEGVANLATDTFLRDVTPPELQTLIAEVLAEVRPEAFAKKLLALPESVLGSAVAEMSSLSSASGVEVRLAVLEALPTAEWLSRDAARQVARKSLEDSHVEVKSRAARILRLLN